MIETIQKIKDNLKDNKILFVEDNIELLMSISRFFMAMEINIEIAKDGQEALDIIKNDKNYKIKIIVTDIVMPKMNGLEIIFEVKKIRKDIHFVIHSAYAETNYLKESKNLNVEEYLLKPFDHIKLLKVISNISVKI